MDLPSTQIPCEIHTNFKQLQIKLEARELEGEIVEIASIVDQMENKAVIPLYKNVWCEIAELYGYALQYSKRYNKLKTGWNKIRQSFEFFLLWKEAVGKILLENLVSVNTCNIIIILPKIPSKNKLKKKLKTVVNLMESFVDEVRSKHIVSCQESASDIFKHTQDLIALLELVIDSVSNLDNAQNKESTQITPLPGSDIISNAIVAAIPETKIFFE